MWFLQTHGSETGSRELRLEFNNLDINVQRYSQALYQCTLSKSTWENSTEEAASAAVDTPPVAKPPRGRAGWSAGAAAEGVWLAVPIQYSIVQYRSVQNWQYLVPELVTRFVLASVDRLSQEDSRAQVNTRLPVKSSLSYV